MGEERVGGRCGMGGEGRVEVIREGWTNIRDFGEVLGMDGNLEGGGFGI